jgi:hypothetical protein
MGDRCSLHAFVLCWPGREAAAHDIAGALAGTADHLTVLYKNDTGQDESGPGDWRRIPSERYYGWQFQESLRLNRGDIMLHVQADAIHSDWLNVARRCRQTFEANRGLGIWSPNVYHSWYIPELTQVSPPRPDGVADVTCTDGVVWALSSALVERLRRLDFSENNIGWGLGEAAAALAVTNDMGVVMDLELEVIHPKGSGYDRTKALAQAKSFSTQLSASQQAYISTILTLAQLRDSRWANLTRGSLWRRKLRERGARRGRAA